MRLTLAALVILARRPRLVAVTLWRTRRGSIAIFKGGPE